MDLAGHTYTWLTYLSIIIINYSLKKVLILSIYLIHSLLILYLIHSLYLSILSNFSIYFIPILALSILFILSLFIYPNSLSIYFIPILSQSILFQFSPSIYLFYLNYHSIYFIPFHSISILSKLSLYLFYPNSLSYLFYLKSLSIRNANIFTLTNARTCTAKEKQKDMRTRSSEKNRTSLLFRFHYFLIWFFRMEADFFLNF